MRSAQQLDAASWGRRVRYASVHALLLVAVEWRLLTGVAGGDGALFAAALAASAAFFFLQGSDPGFLSEELLLRSLTLSGKHNAPFKAEEAPEMDVYGRLLGVEAGGDDSHELEYRRERIQHIQAALLKTQREIAVASDAVDMESRRELAMHDVEAGIPVDELSGKAVSMDFCAECALLPPLRAHHCGLCGRCVATFDHHCLLLATCIGEKNHCRFWWFLLLQSVEIALAIRHTQSGVGAPQSASSAYSTVAHGVLLSVLWALFLLVFGLWCFHTFLALANLTTWEFGVGSDSLGYLRGLGDCDLPFSRGVRRNLWDFGCFPSLKDLQHAWTPNIWALPEHVERDSPRVCQHLWENKYYSCC